MSCVSQDPSLALNLCLHQATTFIDSSNFGLSFKMSRPKWPLFPYFFSTSWLAFLSALSSSLYWVVYTHSKSHMWSPWPCLPSLWLFPSLQPLRVPQWLTLIRHSFGAHFGPSATPRTPLDLSSIKAYFKIFLFCIVYIYIPTSNRLGPLFTVI